MTEFVDFSKGGYKGDFIEETFKPFSQIHLPYWWQFREVLRSNQASNPIWTHVDGSPFDESDYRELIALSLIHYHVYTGITEAIVSLQEMQAQLSPLINASGWQLVQVRRLWKSTYSNLYSSYNALCNIICVTVGVKSPFGDRPSGVWNYTPNDAFKLIRRKGITTIDALLGSCKDRMELRDHLDHFWTVWHEIVNGRFLIDENFKKGYVAVNPSREVRTSIDALTLAWEHVIGCADDFNAIYKLLATSDGYLDQYLQARNWRVDYSDYGEPHNGKRPKP
jgi:hypothetical protein